MTDKRRCCESYTGSRHARKHDRTQTGDVRRDHAKGEAEWRAVPTRCSEGRPCGIDVQHGHVTGQGARHVIVRPSDSVPRTTRAVHQRLSRSRLARGLTLTGGRGLSLCPCHRRSVGVPEWAVASPLGGAVRTVTSCCAQRPQWQTRFRSSRCPHSDTHPRCSTGLPATNACGGTSAVATEPAPWSELVVCTVLYGARARTAPPRATPEAVTCTSPLVPAAPAVDVPSASCVPCRAGAGQRVVPFRRGPRALAGPWHSPPSLPSRAPATCRRGGPRWP
jgi:hypothetical protein